MYVSKWYSQRLQYANGTFDELESVNVQEVRELLDEGKSDNKVNGG
jgi:anti-sigma factor ChrR (cupin superfamily)